MKVKRKRWVWEILRSRIYGWNCCFWLQGKSTQQKGSIQQNQSFSYSNCPLETHCVILMEEFRPWKNVSFWKGKNMRYLQILVMGFSFALQPAFRSFVDIIWADARSCTYPRVAFWCKVIATSVNMYLILKSVAGSVHLPSLLSFYLSFSPLSSNWALFQSSGLWKWAKKIKVLHEEGMKYDWQFDADRLWCVKLNPYPMCLDNAIRLGCLHQETFLI